MKKTLLVSLLSDQTIPNVQIIKEFKNQVTDYLFITTKDMENKGVRRWVESTCEIEGKAVEVNQYSFDDIENQFRNFTFTDYDKVIVNITGGTKVMSIEAFDFFKQLNAKLYYVTNDNKLIQISSKESNHVKSFSQDITLKEYLTAYGFSVSLSEPSGFTFEETKRLYENYNKINLNDYTDALKVLHVNRDKNVKGDKFETIKPFLNAVGFNPNEAGLLTKNETKYLTGGWFEEYIGYCIKQELGLKDDNIMIGAVITKELPQKVKNDVKEMLCNDPNLKGISSSNEMDVMFMYNGTFYSIECKTSLIAYKQQVNSKGELVDKPYNILGETIYKSDSLKGRFGLYPKTSIITLTDFKEYCKGTSDGDHKNKIREMEEFINRANLSGIKLVDKSMLFPSVFSIIK